MHPLLGRLFAIALAAMLFPARAAEEVPFITTPDNVTLAMLEMANVGKRDYVIDLGSGDGRIVITAAARFGAKGLGVELIPDLVRQSRESARRAGVEARTEFREQDLFETDLGNATVVTLYLLPEVNLQLRPRLLALNPGTRIVSHDWDMGEWKPDQTRVLAVPDKKVGFEKSSRVFLWVVPARIEGAWCGTGSARGARLVLRQSFQDFQGELVERGATKPFEGRIEGNAMRITKTADERFELMYSRKRLVMRYGTMPFSSQRAIAFVRSKGSAC
jgi:SAM-dependent methyltransferase